MSVPGWIEKGVECPYCGERISVLVDPGLEHQSYVEDCEVCCQPMVLTCTVAADAGTPSPETVAIEVRRSDD